MDPAQSDFAATIAAAQRGEDRAVAVLWRELNPKLIRFLRVRHGEAADDVASETWLRVSRNIDGFEGSEVEFRAWFFTIARATSIDWYRRAARRPVGIADEAALARHPATDDPETAALDAIDTNTALALIARLPDDQAEVVMLRVVGGLDAEHVGRVMGKRPGNVRVLQHRALRRLAEIVEVERSRTRDVTR